MSKALPLILVTLVFTPVCSLAKESEEVAGGSKSESVYLFIAGDLSAKQGKGSYPIHSMNKRHIVLDKGTGTQKASRNAQILMRLRPTLSYSLVEVSQFDFTFSSTIPSEIEARAMSEMVRHQCGTDTEIAIIPDAINQGGRRSNAYFDQLELLKQENRQFQEDLEYEASDLIFEAERIVDTIHLDLELLPELDYEDAYVAVAVGIGDHSAESKVGSNSQVVVGYLGTLRANNVEEFKLRMSLKPFFAENAVCELFLFSEDGKPVATNLSRGLKAYTREQIEALRREDGGARPPGVP